MKESPDDSHPWIKIKIGDRVLSLLLDSTAASGVVFGDITDSPPCASSWCWGSNNGGPSDSAVVEDGERGDVLRLGGGGTGHYEHLRLQTYLDVSGSYTLSYQVKTSDSFGSGVGEVTWMVRFYSESDEIGAITLSLITDTGGAWRAQTVPIDIPALSNKLGLGENVACVVLECVNYLSEASGSGAGPSISLDDLVVTIDAVVITDAYAYDRDGNVIAAPAPALTTITYDPATGHTSRITLADGNSLIFTYNDAALRSLALYRDSTGGDLAATRTFRDLDGRALLCMDGAGGRTSRFIHGPNGLIAREIDGFTDYILDDHQGSTRVLVDGETSGVVMGYDYLPFGGLMRSGAGAGIHDHVQDQEIRGMGFHVLRGLLAACKRPGRITEHGQDFRDDEPLLLNVVHGHDGFSPPHVVLHGDVSRLRGRFVSGVGKIERERGAPALLGADVDVSVVILHRSPHQGYAQPGAAPSHHLFGVKGFEYPLHVHGQNAGSLVGDGESDVAPGPDVVIPFHGALQAAVFRPDGDGAALGHGLRGVGDEIHKGLGQMGGGAHDVQ